MMAALALPEAVLTAEDWHDFDVQTREQPADIAAYRTLLSHADTELENAFHNGIGALYLVTARARLIDDLLAVAWRAYGLDAQPFISLVAVGGYGRGELHPHSDIDLMLLLTRPANEALAQTIGAFITFLWDIGLPIGHSVRTLEDCRDEAKRDITVATNLMESRLLAGEAAPFERMRELTSPPRIWPSREFFSAKQAEQQRRYHKFDDTAYRLEPNVKEGPGGLRDIQMVGWVAKRHLGAASLHELLAQDFLSEQELQTLITGQTFLWAVRFALHILTGRREDRLLFDHQKSLAELFGYSDADHNLAVEQFMQRYYRTITELQRLNEMLLQHYQETILYADAPGEPERINSRFQIRNGFLEVARDDAFERQPRALLELFLLMQQYPELAGVRASTIRLVRENCHLIDDRFRGGFVNRSLFMEILRQPAGVSHELRRMNRYGVLAAYWPSFARIVGRMQYDLFHAYTVDEHILFVLRNLRRMTRDEHAQELPLCHELFKQIPKPELLYLAALFHDIAKGRGGDHSELGAQEAYEFCLAHGLSDYDAGLVAWLVRYHLLMSLTAQRKDISDPDVIHEFASVVGKAARLNYLYLLTVADISATNPTLWNGWKDTLLQELYHVTKRVLRRGLNNPLKREELAAEVKSSAMALLAATQIPKEAIQRLWEDLDEHYFLRHSDDEIAWHTQAILESDPAKRPLILIRQATPRGSTEITIYNEDRHYLFAHITAALTQLGLNVVDARIITTRTDDALDTFLVLDESGQPIGEAYRLEEIKNALYGLLSNPDHPPIKVARPAPRQLRHFEVPTRIRFEYDPDSPFTLMELLATDHPGLLSRIGHAFIDQHVLVQDARITTIGEQAEDIFYITDLAHRPLHDPQRQETIRAALLNQLAELSVVQTEA